MGRGDKNNMFSLPKTLLYIADPMCSWCWGFSPVMEAIGKKYQDHVNIQLLVGGLRPGNTERFNEHRREYILGHWRAVHQRTGQPFNFDFQMGPDFTYDTEPASRAVVAVRKLQADQVFHFFQDVQRAFYVENLNVTKVEVLADLASSRGIDREQFLTSFQSAELRKNVLEEFDSCRKLDISGFPTLLAQDGQQTTPLAHGYQPIEALIPLIDEWLEKASVL